ncbi:MAG: LysR family transcriptional regulator [Alphaproteobacteria bacterium]|nr:LysR family transcriptional regulator [Alphaproteobacteria bacterium]
MDWDKLRIFHAVAEAGSFTHAGEKLNLSQSAVSRQIGALEETLTVPLFHRHARGLILTEQGEILYRAAHEIFAKLAMTEAMIDEAREKAEGALKVTTTVAFGSVWLTPRLKEFLSLYPDIEVSLILADSELDLSMREADVAIRLTRPRQSDLIQRHIMTMRYGVYATPDYIKEHGMPKTVQDLDNHRIVVYGEDAQPPVANLNWLLTAGLPPGQSRRAILKVNSVYGIFRAVQGGLGIGALPEYMSYESTNLVEVLPETKGPSVEMFFAYPEELKASKRVSVFRDWVVAKLQAGKGAAGFGSSRG